MSQDWYIADTVNERWRSVRNGTNVPWPGAATALLVVRETPLSAADTAVESLLTGAGYTVVTRTVTDSEDYSGIDVVVNTFGGSDEDTGTYLYPPCGFVAVDSWRTFGMGTILGFQSATNLCEVVDVASPLAAGVTGTYDLYLTAQFVTWEADVGADADVIVSRPSEPSQAVVFAYEAGSSMPGRFATTRHVGLGFHDDGFVAGLTADAEAQFVAAVDWAASSSYVAPAAPAIPTGVSATAGGGLVSLSWAASDTATSYTVKRAEVTDGPYSDVASVAGTSYTDTGLTEATEYFYVVAAVSPAGVSDDSAEVSATPTAAGAWADSIFVTPVELTMWQDRAVNGPFKTAEDFSTNSPGHYDTMLSKLGTDWSSARWSGPTRLDGQRVMSNRDGIGTDNDPPASVREMANDMMSAAYAAVISGNTSDLPLIVDEIEAQSNVDTLDFGSRTRYPYEQYFDQNPLFIYAIWVMDYMRAYDVCKGAGYTSARVEEWFADLADLCNNENDSSLTDVFPNRATGDWTTSSSAVTNDTADLYWRKANGDPIYGPTILLFYNNRRSACAAQAAFAGALLGNTTLSDSAKIYYKEWVMFGHRTTDGVHGDWNRTNGSQTYAFNTLLTMVTGADALARTGDTEIYDFSSSTGSPGTWGTAHLKSFEDVCNSYAKWIWTTGAGGYPDTYWSSSAANAGNIFYRHDTRRTDTNRELVTDAGLLLAANYYGRTDWAGAVNRTATTWYQFTDPPHPFNNGTPGWASDLRTRFLRSTTANPYV